MFLTSTTRKLQIDMTAAKTTTDMPVQVYFEDITGSVVEQGESLASSNGVTATDILAAPANGTNRKVTGISVHNIDTAAKTVQINLDDNGTSRRLIEATLAVGDTLGYTPETGWYVQDANGNRKTTSTIGSLLSTSPSTGVGYATGAGATVTQITNRSTGVTINAVCGKIQTDTTSLAAGASAEFTVTNSAVAIGDVVVVSQRSGSSNVAGVAGVTHVSVVTVAAGSFIVSVDNNSSTTAETGAIIINFAVVKAVSI